MEYCVYGLANMVATFLGLSLLWIAGFQVCRWIAARTNCTTNVWIEAGAGFYIAAALLILFLTNVPAPLITASWGAVFGCALIALPLLRSAIHPIELSTRTFNLASISTQLPRILIITLIAAHLVLVLANNLTRDIYPWDAFTTWMYRAKIWVLNNALLDFQTVDQWLQSGGEGYAIHAAHYPASVSAVAAFASVLSGGWSDHAASLPWFFAMLATGSLMFGLCRQGGWSTLPSLIGTYGLISIPLVSIHGVLAGYADLWVLGTSGMGLAAVLLWAQQQEKGLLCVGAALLINGCFIKIEGFIWLGLGLLFIFLLVLWRRYQFRALSACVGLLLLCIVLESAHLGPLGIWGVQDGAIHVGPLGQYALRPFNPLPVYFEMIFIRGNFHLLGLFYLAALTFLTLRNWRSSASYWLMGGLIAASQWTIFGWSSYSLYAETGTAINRLLIHFLPVFVVTSVAGLQAATRDWIGRTARTLSSMRGRIASIGIILLTPFATPALIDWKSNSESNPPVSYPSEALVPVLGNLREIDNGSQQFTGTPGPVAVAKVRLKNPGALPARYVVPDVQISGAGTVSFYWINSENPQVHTYVVDVSGPTIIDMQSVAAYGKKPIAEMGYLVAKQSLGDVQLGDIQITDVIVPGALLAALNHWMTADPISQSSINSVDGHLPSPISWGMWQSIMLVLAVLLTLVFAIIAKSAAPQAATGCITLAAVLWLASDVISLRQLTLATYQLVEGEIGTGRQMNTGKGEQLREIADTISRNRNVEAGVNSIALDRSGEFQAQKLPLLLAPRAAIATNLATATRLTKTWRGHFAVFSDDQTTIEVAVNKLEAGTNPRIIGRGEDYIILSRRQP
ncbi:hypothetical protein N9485_00730 [Luminiphilus sp.]|nr:hypothetical protein [Luminiphilus sp.]